MKSTFELATLNDYKYWASRAGTLEELETLMDKASENIENNDEYIEFYEFCMDIVRRA